MPDLRSEFWAPRRERLRLANADRRDLLEMMAGQARYFDRVYGETFDGEEPDLTRAEFVAHALGLFDEASDVMDQPLERFVLNLFGDGGEVLAELDPEDEFAWLTALESSARRLGAQHVAVLARVAIAQLTESELGVVGWRPDVALTVLLRLRELVRLLDELLVAIIRRRAWLKQMSEELIEAFDGEEEAERTEPQSLLEHGPPPPVWLSAVQPHAPPERFFSAPRGESVEMRLSRAREGLMAA